MEPEAQSEHAEACETDEANRKSKKDKKEKKEKKAWISRHGLDWSELWVTFASPILQLPAKPVVHHAKHLKPTLHHSAFP